MCRASCAVFYSDDIFVLNVKSYFHDNEHCISSTPYRGGGSRVCRASCAVFYSDSKIPGAVFHSDTSPYRGGDSTVCRASCAVFYSDTKVRQYSDIFVSSKSKICIKSLLYFSVHIGVQFQSVSHRIKHRAFSVITE